MKVKFKKMLLVLALLATGMSNSFAQVVTLIDPAGDGGFESGSTFAANNWTVAAGVATNQWFVGSAGTPFAGSNCAYISETGNGSSYTYNFTSASTVYFYRDITFPANKPRILLTVNWKCAGEPSFDRGMVCYTDPANTPVVNDFMSSTPPQYATSVTGNFNSWQGNAGVWSTATTYLLPSSFAGTTKRIIFGWQNNATTGTNPPIAFDNISLTAEENITCTPIAEGGFWSDPASWTGGLFPSSGDDVVIPDGSSITVDVGGSSAAFGVACKNLTIGGGASGVLNFTQAFNVIGISGNLTVNNGGQFNGFTQTQSPTAGGVTVNVAGNINLNAGATMTMAHSGALLNMNGTAPQSINGPGVFLDGLIRVFQIPNPTSVTLNNIPLKVTEGLRHYAGTLNTNGNLTLDNTAQSYGNTYNQGLSSIIVTNMGTVYAGSVLVHIGTSGAVNWTASTPVQAGALLFTGTNYYYVTISGTTGATAPVHVNTALNGTATLQYIADPNAGGTGATAVANLDNISHKIRSITVTNPGTGYRGNPTVTMIGGGPATPALATAVVIQSIAGAFAFTTIKNGGTTINGGITTINNSQGVGGINTVNSQGTAAINNRGYTSAPTVGFTLPARTFNLTSTGSGYSSPTVPTFSGGTIVTAGTAPTISAIVANGKMISVTIVAGTTTYSVAPTILLGGSGSGAVAPVIDLPTATAAISNGMVSGYTVTNPGSGYVTVPTMTLAGGGFAVAAAIPTCRIGLYNVQYSIVSAPTGPSLPAGYTIVNVAVVEGTEIPANRKINTLTLNNLKNLTLNDNLELTAATGAIGLTGLVTFSGANNTITCSNPAYAGTAGTSSLSFGYVIGKVTLTSPGGFVTRTFPMERHGFAILTAENAAGGIGAVGVGCDITSLTGEAGGIPSGTFTTGAYTFPGNNRSFKLTNNTPGSQYGTKPIAQVNYTVAENLISDLPGLHVAQAAINTGPWTVRSISAGTGNIVATGNKQTAITSPGAVILTGVDYFSFATTFTPPAGLNNYRITRTTGNTFNSIALTGNTFPSWTGSPATSTETNKTSPVSLSGTTFQYQGTTVTGFLAGLDGYLSFNTAYTSNLSAILLGQQSSGFANIDRCLAPLWANTSCSNLNQIRYLITGTLGSGSAVITVQWSNMTGSNNPVGNTNSDLTFQIKLFESDNHIEYNYGLMKAFDGSHQAHWSYACGMNGSFVTLYPAPGQVLALQDHYENTTNFTNENVVSQSRGANALHTMPECYSSYKFELLSPIPFVPGSGIPANDDAVNAVTLIETASPPSDYCSATFTSFGSTASAPVNACVGSSASKDVWFKFVAIDTETAIKVVSSGGYDAVVQVFDASFNSISACVNATVDGRAEVAAVSGLILNDTYYVRVFHNIVGTQATATPIIAAGGFITGINITNPGSGYGLTGGASFGTPRVTVSGGGGNNAVLEAITTGTFSIPGGITDMLIRSAGIGYTSAPTITIDPPSAGLTGDFAIVVYSNTPPPANDIICGAVSLTVGVATCSPTAGSTFGATASGGMPTCTGVADEDVFYSFVAPAGGNPVTVQVQGSVSFDAVMQILSSSDNTCNGILSSVSCNNATITGGLESITSSSLTAGNTYFVRVYHASAGAGSGTFTICVFESGPPCPVQTAPSDNGLVNINGATLTWNSSVGATGYDVYFSSVQADVISGAPAALVSSNQPGLTYSTGALVNATVYYWRVDARNIVGASVGCTLRSFTSTTDIIIGGNATVCSGSFYDSGGPSGNYSNNENAVSIICPSTPGTSSSLTFTSYGLGLLTGDFLSIYNGNSILSPQFPGSPFGAGVGGPTGSTFISTDISGCITVKFTSDGNNPNVGWAASINCVVTCAAAPTSPVNGGNSCELSNTILTWPSNPGASGYNVYLDNGPSAITLVSANQPGNTFNAGILPLGTYSWKVVTLAGVYQCASPSTWSFTVQPIPTPVVTTPVSVCEGLGLSLTANNSAGGQTSSYNWTTTALNGFTATNNQSPSVTGAASVAQDAGTYTVTIQNQFSCTATANIVAVVNPNPVISGVVTNVSCWGFANVCDGAVLASATSGDGNYTFDDGSNFNVDGDFSLNQPLGPVAVCFGPYVITVTDGLGCSSTQTYNVGALSTALPSASVTVPPINNLPAFACNTTTASNINVPTVGGATKYIWDAPSGTMFNSIPNPTPSNPFTNTTPTANITFGSVVGSGSGYLVGVQAANGCGATIRKVQWVRGILSSPTVTGPTVICGGGSGVYSITNPAAMVGAVSYTWTGPVGSTIDGNASPYTTTSTAAVTLVVPGGFTSGTMCVVANAGCISTPPKCISISISPAVLGVLSGNFTVCPPVTEVYTVSNPGVVGGTYNWILPANTTGSVSTLTNSNTLNILVGFTGGDLKVSYTNTCGVTSALRSKSIGIGLPTVPASITAANTNGLCAQLASFGCPPQTGATFNWTFPTGSTPASITAGGNNVSSTMPGAPFTSGQVCVTATNGCGTSTARCITVKGTPLTPGVTTTNPSSWCAPASAVQFIGNVSALTGVYSLNWTVLPAAAASYVSGQGTSNYTADWNTVGAASINLTATNACGSTTRALAVNIGSCLRAADATATIAAPTVNVYPNPATELITITYGATQTETVQLQLKDVSGRVVMNSSLNAQEGENQSQMDVSTLAKGVYMLEVNGATAKQQVRVVVQ